MALKFHLNWKGEPGRCTATVNACPLGGDDEHFSTPKEAREAFEARHASSFGSPVIRDRKTDPTYADALRYDHLSKLTEGKASVSELAELDGFDGKEVEARLSEYREGLVRRAQEARIRAKLNPNSMGDEIEAQRAEVDAGLTEPRRAAKKTTTRKPKPVSTSWRDMKVPDPSESKIIVPPQENDPYGGYMGGRKWVGGKVPDKYQSDTEAAKLLRADVRAAIKAGELPADLDYSVRKGNSGYTSSLRIYVGQKGESGRAEPLSDEDKQDTRLRPILTYLEALGNQYATDDSNSMVDYFNSHNRTRAEFRDRWT